VIRVVPWVLLGVALVAGTLADRAPQHPPWFAGPYRVLAADLHVHPFPSSASTLAPWDLVLEARHRGLDAIAVTGHNEAYSGQVARWFSRMVGGPTVIAGEEIHGPHFHMIAAGIQRTISWRLSAKAAIAEIHRQGGVAIAAHPTQPSWPFFLEAISQLDGAEVAQPVVLQDPKLGAELREFYRESGAAAIGSSDWHGMGPLGLCRTYVFATDDSAAAILEAIRARRTVVVDRGNLFGNLELARLAGGRLEQERPSRSVLAWFSTVCGVAGLAALALVSLRTGLSRRDPPPALRTAPSAV
jgi:PHP-associated